MSEKFKTSLAEGNHAFLTSLEGKWKGTTKVWFEPGVLADESPCEGTIKIVLGGRFVMHEYTGSLEQKPVEGIALYGYSIANQEWQAAWIDSFHNGTNIMFSTGKNNSLPFSVHAFYTPEPAWGWRTEIEMPNKNNLVITMFNIAPGGSGDKAVEINYIRH